MSEHHRHSNCYDPLCNRHRCRTCSDSSSSSTWSGSCRSFCSPRTRSDSASTRCLPCDSISSGCGMLCGESCFSVTCSVVRCKMSCTVRVLIAVHHCGCVMNADHDSNTNCFLHSNYSNSCSWLSALSILLIGDLGDCLLVVLLPKATFLAMLRDCQMSAERASSVGSSFFVYFGEFLVCFVEEKRKKSRRSSNETGCTFMWAELIRRKGFGMALLVSSQSWLSCWATRACE
jgi:hypothetical protein